MTDFIVREEKSKYIKPARENKIFYACSIFFLFNMFVMPQYFGIPTPGFDLTVLRIGIILVSLMIFADTERAKDFLEIIKTSLLTKTLAVYVIVILYTMVFRADFNAFLNPFMEIYATYLVIYVVKKSIGVENILKLVIVFCYIMTLLGVLEAFLGFTPFCYLVTLDGIYTGSFVRSGSYRIMSSFSHSLGYGLFLIIVTPLSVYNIDEKKIHLVQHPLLLILFVINVFMTGSRSTLGVLFLELAILIVLAERENRKRFLVGFVMFLLIFLAVVFALQGTSFGKYVLLQVTTVIDSAFGTTYSVKYGADLNALGASSNYREQLKGIFSVSWLNPILGLGRKRAFSGVINGNVIRSIDSFYIAEYVRYAYPGMFSFIFFLVFWMIKMALSAFGKQKNNLAKIVVVGVGCYLLNLYWVDSLQTFKYMYLMIAIWYCDSEVKASAAASRYIKKPIWRKK